MNKHWKLKCNNKNRSSFFLCLLVSMGVFTGCSLLPENSDVENKTNKEAMEIVTSVGSYDSLDDAIFVSMNKDDSTMKFQNMETGKFYTLNYDGTTSFVDKYEEAISSNQLVEGEMVHVAFRKAAKHLTSLKISKEAWNFSEVENFRIDESKNSISIGQTIYKLGENAVVLSEGNRMELMDINQKDILFIRGIDKTVYSISLQKGHGYVKLENYDELIGGFLEFGQSLILPIKENMLYVIPEGTYEVLASFNGNRGTYTLDVKRGGEYTLDLADVMRQEIVYTAIDFQILPTDASLTIDGQLYEEKTGIQLSQGLHEILVEKEGYESATQFLKVGTKASKVEIMLEEAAEDDSNAVDSQEDETIDTEDDDTDTANTTNTQNTTNTTESQNTTQNTETESSSQTQTTNPLANYKIFITLPEKAELYVDGIYIGITPISYTKKSGNQVITLRKTGYQTRSYTISVDSEMKDVTYTFPELLLQGE